MCPGNPPQPWRGNLCVATRTLCVATREWGPEAGREANRANRANRCNQPPSEPAPSHQVTFQVTCGVSWGAYRANRGPGGEGTRRSANRVQHRGPLIGHGWPWQPGQLLFEQWRSIHIYIVLAAL